MINPSNLESVNYGDSLSVDSLSRLRASNQSTVINYKNTGIADFLLWEEFELYGDETSGSLTDKKTYKLSVGNVVGTRVRQTLRHFHLEAGRSLFITVACIIGSTPYGIEKKIGYFDDSNGVFFKIFNNEISLAYRGRLFGGTFEELIARASWLKKIALTTDSIEVQNEADFVLDLESVQVLWFDLGWYASDITCGFLIDGEYVPVARIQSGSGNMNSIFAIPFGNYNLPLRLEIANYENVDASTLEFLAASITADMPKNPVPISRSVRRLNCSVAAADGGFWIPLLSLRLLTSSDNSSVNITPTSLSINCSSGNNYDWGIFLNPTFSAEPSSWQSLANSPIQFNRFTTVTHKLIFSDTESLDGKALILGSTAQTQNLVNFSLDEIWNLTIKKLDGFNVKQDVLVLAIYSYTSASAKNYSASFSFKELI